MPTGECGAIDSTGEFHLADFLKKNDLREKFYHLQLYEAVEARVLSRAFLQAAAKVGFVCGFEASCFQEERHCSIEVFDAARAASGTLSLIQASYFWMKSSHSATPIALAVDALVFAAVFDVLPPVFAELAGVLALPRFELLELVTTAVFELLELLAVGAELQPANPKTPQRVMINKGFLFNLITIRILSEKFQI